MGCSEKVELYREVSEVDANSVIAELSTARIKASKQARKAGVSVLVDVDDMPRAVRILEAAGLPKKSRSSLGEIFKKEGIISTPTEERARYIYALSQELENTLSQIDGVVKVRVHVVLSERIAHGEPILPSSAGVFIKHEERLDPDVVRPIVKRMVMSSIPGLSGTNEEKLAVAFTLAEEPVEIVTQMKKVGPFWVLEKNAKLLAVLLVLLPILLLIVILVSIFFLLRKDKQQKIVQNLTKVKLLHNNKDDAYG